MVYFDLPVINKELIKKLGVSKLEHIDVKPEHNALPRNCLSNAKSYVERHGGQVQLGWIFACMGNIAIKMTAHAVVKLKNGSMLCVTPNEFRVGKLKFAPDSSIEKLIRNGFLPTRFVALVNDDTLGQYLNIEKELDQLRLDNNGIVTGLELQNVQMKASLLYPSILALAKQHTGRNDCCFCGSGKKRKKCCG
ncbi:MULTISPECIES: hypothetical protein [Vibrio]|uniref:hypothetical protein n=1 Tax=Vibrio TaxID=662 RepID=UPI000619ADDF|nr:MULTISPECIES: hypothetical protein [Vibrio]QCI73579.1 hypothetical protein FAZ90_21505 [Vibrio cyclitrophicus]